MFEEFVRLKEKYMEKWNDYDEFFAIEDIDILLVVCLLRHCLENNVTLTSLSEKEIEAILDQRLGLEEE